jgi:hypothetical protein
MKSPCSQLFFVTCGNKQTVIANNYIQVKMLIGLKLLECSLDQKLRDVEAPNKDQSQKAKSSL